MTKLKEDPQRFAMKNLHSFLKECLGFSCPEELDWVSDCIRGGMSFYLEIENHARSFRLPLVLAEPVFVSEMRRGAALRSLRRINILSRLANIIEGCLDEILSGEY